jgi:hypothetical protein
MCVCVCVCVSGRERERVKLNQTQQLILTYRGQAGVLGQIETNNALAIETRLLYEINKTNLEPLIPNHMKDPPIHGSQELR